MKTQRRWRYYCDFCKKSGGSKSAMLLHEKHCTMNPNRECRMCGKLGQPQPKMTELIALLSGKDTVAESLPKLRDAAGECPICILAALRQAKVLDQFVEGRFDYKKECARIFAEMNADDCY